MSDHEDVLSPMSDDRFEDSPEEYALLEITADLGDREMRCLLRIANRLLQGQRLYGELSPGKKNWKREAKEEAMDMAVYLSALLEDDCER